MSTFKNVLKQLIFFCLPILCCLNISLSAVAAEELFQEEKTQEILNHLVFTDHESETAKKWEHYLKESTWFSDTEHQMDVIQLGLEFASAVSSLSDCIVNMEQKEKKYSSEWVKDFQEEFDLAYISKNFDSIKFIVSCMYARYNLQYCYEQKKEALYREIMYRQSVENYMSHLRSFSESLDEKEQKKINDRLAIVNTYLEGHQYPLQILLSPGSKRLFVIALKNRKDLDPKVVSFFSNHPFFQKPFNPRYVVGDLESLVQPLTVD